MNYIGVTPYIYQSTDMLDWELVKPDYAIRYFWRPKFAKPNGQYWVSQSLLGALSTNSYCA